MKKTLTLVLAGALALSSTNCTTTYDVYGNPRQSVDPGTAVAGAAAVGVLGYALARNRSNNNRYNNNRYNDNHYSHHRGHYDRRGYYHHY